MFFHSPKLFPQDIALTSSNSKDIIKDHHANSLVKNSRSFASSSGRSEKDNKH